MILPNVNYLHAAVLLRALVKCGARQVVISPGSRSTPLAHTAMCLPELEQHVLIDERSAAFFALGLSRGDEVPAILICTSGTAAANYYPAVIEAAQSQTSLIVLTADRPLVLRNSGAPQTIDQSHLYGRYPKFFADLPEARLSIEHCHDVRRIAAQAFSLSVTSPFGPAHLNVPLDEPLAPIRVDETACGEIWEEWQHESPVADPERPALRTPPHSEVDRVYDVLDRAMCGLIVCGPNSARTPREAEAILHLARQLGWPVLADVVSGVRFYGHPVLPHYDIFLRQESLAALAPDVVLAFGAYPTSKLLNSYLDRHRGAHTIRIQPHLLRQDPTARASEVIESDVAWLCEELAESVEVARDSLLLDPFQRASTLVAAELENVNSDACEAMFVYDALRLWPDRGNIVLASSLSIRYADALAAGNGNLHHAYAMRGANGIDGTISFASGVARASQTPTLLILGDLAFCHDLSGLMSARSLSNLTVLLLNNDGGGIFHFLPAYGTSEHFEAIQGTPHGSNLSAAKELFGLDWRRAATRADLMQSLAETSPRARVLEVAMSRVDNHRAHCALFEHLSKASVTA
jgi:2-succinyl-5-enolpyruvyl-6-hydroxy-3-cyclohexene-1-carboxylate synthase